MQSVSAVLGGEAEELVDGGFNGSMFEVDGDSGEAIGRAVYAAALPVGNNK